MMTGRTRVDGLRNRRALGLAASVAIAAGGFAVLGTGTSGADVTGVIGSAYGYNAPNTVLFGGAQPPIGPTPIVALPAGGSPAPITAHADTGRVAYGPGVLFTSGAIDVSTVGTTGPGGSVTSTAHITNNPTSNVGEILYGGTIDSTCTATEAGTTGEVSLAGPGDAGHTSATLRTSDGNPDIDGDETYVDLPLHPEPNLSISGNLESVGDHFTVVFNEQVQNPDGSLTVYAAHEYLLGPTLTGDLYLGKVTCGVTSIPTTTSSSTSTSTSTSTSSSTSTTSTTVPPPAGALTCKVKHPISGRNYVLCQIRDPQGVRHINVTSARGGFRELSVAIAPRPPTKTVSFRINMTGDAHRVAIMDLAGNRAKFSVADNGAVTPL